MQLCMCIIIWETKYFHFNKTSSTWKTRKSYLGKPLSLWPLLKPEDYVQPVLLALATAMLLWIATRHVLEDLSRRPNQNRIVRLGVGTEKLEGNKSGATSNLPLALRVRCTRRVCCPDDPLNVAGSSQRSERNVTYMYVGSGPKITRKNSRQT